ncbi:type II toxin-antitoxin system HipA family toxin [Salana multivorans]
MRLAFALYGHVAGIIERDAGTTTLRYLREYQLLDNPTPLSLSMPVSDVTYPSRPVEAYLRGLLPDHAEVRRRWARKAGVREGNTLGLIAHVGMDVSGGAIFADEGSIADALASRGEYEPASQAEIAQRLRRVRQDDAAWQGDEDDEPWSLAGAQSKFTLAQVDGGWAFAGGSAPSTHIVKPGIGRIRAQALSEHVSMRALAIAGLPVAQTQYLRFEDQDAIVVTRFDRRRNAAGSLVRVHQEDLIQAFAMDPGRKYEADQGPGVQQIATLLRSAAGEDSVRQFARAVIANQLLGAPDAHGKNYSLLLAGRSASLTPLYDVATGLIPDGEGRLRYTKGAMSIGGERGFGDIEARHWEKFARAIGVPIADVRAWVEELAHSIPPAFAQAAAEVDTDDARLLGGPVADDIAAAAEQTMAGLTAGRRARGRLRTPFVQTLPPGRVLRGATPGGQHTVVPRAESDVDLAISATDDEPWGS